jgi:hypothetical protein
MILRVRYIPKRIRSCTTSGNSAQLKSYRVPIPCAYITRIIRTYDISATADYTTTCCPHISCTFGGYVSSIETVNYSNISTTNPTCTCKRNSTCIATRDVTEVKTLNYSAIISNNSPNICSCCAFANSSDITVIETSRYIAFRTNNTANTYPWPLTVNGRNRYGYVCETARYNTASARNPPHAI